MNAQTSCTNQPQFVASRVAVNDSGLRRMYRNLLAGLGFAACILAATPVLAQSLGTAARFAILGETAVNANGTGSIINGDVGVDTGSSITGFPANANVSAAFSVHAPNDGPSISARADVGILSGALAGATQTSTISPLLQGQNLGPGTYDTTVGTALLTNTSPLILDGAGVYIFRVMSDLTADSGSSVSLINGADPCNVFWLVPTLATLNGATFPGNIVAGTGIHLDTAGSSLTGRALAAGGDVTLAGSNTVGGCSAAVTAPGGISLSKAFLPSTIFAGGVSTLTITLSNNNATAATLISPLTDTLVGMVVAPTPNASTDCGDAGFGGGVVSAVAGGGTVTLSTQSTIPGGAPGTCTVTVDVTAPTAGSFPNTLAADALVTSFGNNAQAVATLNVLASTSSPIPTLSEWAIIMLASLLAFAGYAAMRRQAI